MNTVENYARIKAGLEAKYFGDEEMTPRLRQKLDSMWNLAQESTMDWSTTHKEEIQGTKDYYAKLVDLVKP